MTETQDATLPTKVDPRLPTKITYEDAEPGSVCTQHYSNSRTGHCSRPAKWSITWQHLHRGTIKTAKRKRCSKHGRQFFRRHGVTVN